MHEARLNLTLARELYDSAKLKAASLGLSLAAYIRMLISLDVNKPDLLNIEED